MNYVCLHSYSTVRTEETRLHDTVDGGDQSTLFNIPTVGRYESMVFINDVGVSYHMIPYMIRTRT
jgi:hypothetical protein